MAGAGSGCGRIGVKSTVAPACTSANSESQTCREISCLIVFGSFGGITLIYFMLLRASSLLPADLAARARPYRFVLKMHDLSDLLKSPPCDEFLTGVFHIETHEFGL